MRIREARLEDASAIARVHIDAWRETYQGIIPDTYLAQLSYETDETMGADVSRSARVCCRVRRRSRWLCARWTESK